MSYKTVAKNGVYHYEDMLNNAVKDTDLTKAKLLMKNY